MVEDPPRTEEIHGETVGDLTCCNSGRWFGN